VGLTVAGRHPAVNTKPAVAPASPDPTPAPAGRLAIHADMCLHQPERVQKLKGKIDKKK
jgi:hypothetical protein